MKDKNGKMIDTVYIGYGMDTTLPIDKRTCLVAQRGSIENYTEKKENLFFKSEFYLNLDTISLFILDKVKYDLKIKVKKNHTTNIEKKILIKKGTPIIELFRKTPYDDKPYMTLVFPHHGEYQRFQRILADKLCIK
jgi:hypothetical protein